MDMTKDIANLRREYSGVELNELKLNPDPLKQFEIWMSEALNAEVPDPHAMVLSTVSAKGKPSARVVLLRGIQADGLTFYTNYRSRKAEEIRQNPFAAVVFFWHELDRQVRGEGRISKADETESDRYFASRPRPSQLAAWASDQSHILSGRDELERKFREIDSRFEGSPVPRPDHWGGYRIHMDCMEFWQGRPSRLHDRILYSLGPQGIWTIKRLAP